MKNHYVEITCDMDGTPEAVETEFDWDGRSYRLDLSQSHREKIADFLQPYMAKAQRIEAEQVRADHATKVQRLRTAVARPAVVDRAQNRAIRDWAARKGMDVSPRGRIRADIISAYHREAGFGAAEAATVAVGAAMPRPTGRKSRRPRGRA